jgi:hypothetical protein
MNKTSSTTQILDERPMSVGGVVSNDRCPCNTACERRLLPEDWAFGGSGNKIEEFTAGIFVVFALFGGLAAILSNLGK